MTSLQIVGAGLVSVDNLFLVKRNGTFGDDSEYEGITPKQNLPCRYLGSHGGGSTSNTLCILAKLGVPSTIIGAVGTDPGSKLVYDEFQRFEVDTGLLVQKDAPTRQFSHLIFPGHHEFRNICPICRNRFSRAPLLKEQDIFSNSNMLGRIENCDILHIDRANRLMLKLVDHAYKEGKVISFDFGYQAAFGDYDVVSEIIKRTAILKTSRAAARTFLSRLQKRDFLELNPRLKLCVITLGDKGSRVTFKSRNRVESLDFPAYSVSPVVDRAGAGDAFHAGLLYGLKDSLDEMTAEPVLNSALDLARGFAGLACTEYGSRGYFLRKLQTSDFRSSVFGDVEALKKGELKWTMMDPDALFAQHRDRLSSHDVCGACGNPFREGGDTIYDRNIDSAPWSMATTYNAAMRSREISCNPGQRLYLVGSGASLSVAQFGAILLNQLTDVFGVAITPYEYVSLSRQGSPTILISFGGNNPDILAAFACARDSLSPSIHVITGNTKSELARAARQVDEAVIHEVPSKVFDAGFVSTQGLLACASMLWVIVARSFGFADERLSGFFKYENLNELFTKAKKDIVEDFARFEDTFDSMEQLHLVALGSGWAWPAVVDFESKITEGGVCTIEISELKNYTHGRYLNAYRNKESRFFVLFGLPADSPLIRFLKDKLGKYFPVMEIASKLEPPFGTLDLLVRGLYASSVISKKIGLDIARATRFPKESRGLYSWGPIYTPASKIEEFLHRGHRQKNSANYQAKLA